MFRNTYQSGLLSILYSLGSKPLQLWEPSVEDGCIQRVVDEDIQSSVVELTGSNVATASISCPADPKAVLGIKLPVLVLIVKNLKQYFSFEVQILDDKNVRRRFRASNYQRSTKVKPFICTMPLRLDDGWNQIQFNLADFVKRAYGKTVAENISIGDDESCAWSAASFLKHAGTTCVEALRVQVHANCRIRRIYFADRVYSDAELPAEFKLFAPLQPSVPTQ